MKKKYLNERQISKLKNNLMPNKNKRNKKSKRSKSTRSPDNLSNTEEFTPRHRSSSLSSEFYKMNNKEIGVNFETNIRQILEIYYGCKKIAVKRKVLYRKIIYDGKIEFVTDIKDKEIIVKDQSVIFHLNQSKSLDINTGSEKKTIKDDKPYEYNFLENKIIIYKPMEMELDGIYENFELERLNKEEIECIWQNIDNPKISSYKKIVLEIKLNKNKIEELLYQLKRDKEFLGLLGKEDYLFIGVINSKSLNHEIVREFIKNNKNLNFIILGIKNSLLANKDVTKFYDWDEIKKVMNLENKVMNLEKKIGILGKDVENVKKQLIVNNDLLLDIKRLLMKKRKRGKPSTDNKK